MADPSSAFASASGVPYWTEPGSVERELVCAINRLADLEEKLRQRDELLRESAAELQELKVPLSTPHTSCLTPARAFSAALPLWSHDAAL